MEAEGEHPDVIWATPSLAGATVSPHATPLMYKLPFSYGPTGSEGVRGGVEGGLGE